MGHVHDCALFRGVCSIDRKPTSLCPCELRKLTLELVLAGPLSRRGLWSLSAPWCCIPELPRDKTFRIHGVEDLFTSELTRGSPRPKMVRIHPKLMWGCRERGLTLRCLISSSRNEAQISSTRFSPVPCARKPGMPTRPRDHRLPSASRGPRARAFAGLARQGCGHWLGRPCT